MFDVGFPELLLVSMVALLVIGPERLPETVRTIMLWLGRVRTSFANIKMEIEKEIGADEIRQQLHNESILKELDESRRQIKDAMDALQRPTRSEAPPGAQVAQAPKMRPKLVAPGANRGGLISGGELRRP